MEAPQKTSNRNTIGPNNSIPWNLPKKTASQIQKDICTPMFFATLFTKGKIWKQPKCPLVYGWIKKTWYIYTMEYYSAIRKKQILPFVTIWIELEGIMLMK